jgi:hypothetical protein
MGWNYWYNWVIVCKSHRFSYVLKIADILLFSTW